MISENSFSILEEDECDEQYVVENGSEMNAGLREDDLGQYRDGLTTREQLYNESALLKKVISVNDELHEYEVLDLCHQVNCNEGK